MKKRVLIHSLVFNPDGVSTAYLYGDIALALKKYGFDVKVLTTTPHYNIVESQVNKQPIKWKVWGFLKQSDFNGIKVFHVPQKKFKSTPLRLIGFVYWHIISFITALFIKNVDIILSPSPPLTIGWLNIILGKLKRAKVIYNVQEVYPDILGIHSGIIYNVLSKMEHFIYSNSHAITTIDDIFYNTIKPRFVDGTKLSIIPNFVDTDLYRPIPSECKLDSSLFADNNHLKLLYAGNIGIAQDWDTLIELAKISHEKDIDYYVIGEGVKLGYLRDNIEKYKLSNIKILPYQPRELMPDIIAFSDIQFIFMEPEIAAQGFPSKVYTIMACAKPMIVCSPKGTPIVNFLENIGCARIVTCFSAKEKACEILNWLKGVERNELKEMGLSGYREIQSKYSKDIVTAKYCKLLNSL